MELSCNPHRTTATSIMEVKKKITLLLDVVESFINVSYPHLSVVLYSYFYFQWTYKVTQHPPENSNK